MKAVSLPEYTPDLFRLEQAERQLVFECGPLRYDAPYVGTAYTVEKYTLLKQHERVAIPLRHVGFPKARVQGTLYIMTPEQIVELDKKRKNGVVYARKLTAVTSPIVDKYGDPIRLQNAWIYKGVPNYWYPQVEWDMQANRCGGLYMVGGSEFLLAEQFPAEHKFFHNHYSFSGITVEMAAGMPEITVTQASAEIIKMIGAKNEIEIRRLEKHINHSRPSGIFKSAIKAQADREIRFLLQQRHRLARVREEQELNVK